MWVFVYARSYVGMWEFDLLAVHDSIYLPAFEYAQDTWLAANAWYMMCTDSYECKYKRKRDKICFMW